MQQRYSKQRECIKNALCATTAHPDAETLLKSVRREIPDLSLATVYRNLNEMVLRGEALVIESGDGRIHYDGQVKPHAHFVCRGCGCILDAEATAAHEMERQGYLIESVNVVLRGLCPECQKKA